MADGFASYRCLLAKAGDAVGKKIDHATSSTQDIVDMKNDVAAIVGLTPGGAYLADVITALVEGGVAAGDQMIAKKYGVALPGVAEKLGALVEKWGCGTVPRVDAPVSTAGRVVTPQAIATPTVSTGAYMLQASPYMTSAQMLQAALAARNAVVPDAGYVDPGAPVPVAAGGNNTVLLLGAAALAALLFMR